MHTRIREVRKDANLNQEEFGERLGKSRIAITGIELGRSNVDDTFIRLLCREFNIDECWLRTGQGSMHPTRTPDADLERLIGEALTDKPDNVKRAALEIFAGLDDEGWEAMYTVIKKLRGE